MDFNFKKLNQKFFEILQIQLFEKNKKYKK